MVDSESTPTPALDVTSESSPTEIDPKVIADR